MKGSDLYSFYEFMYLTRNVFSELCKCNICLKIVKPLYWDQNPGVLCEFCFVNKFEIFKNDIECFIKNRFIFLVYYYSKYCISDIVRFYIGKNVKERNRKHKFERKCYHFHKATCKTIYAFCLFAKRYYPLELNKDVRLKICKLILE